MIAAMAIVAWGVVSVAHAREFLAHQRATGGVVTASSDAYCGPTSGPIRCTDRMTIRYQPPGSGPLVLTGDFDSTRIPVGTHVLVYYLERDPGDARLDPGTGQQADGIAAIAAGLAVSALGYWAYRDPAPRRRRPAGG
jgi:hypothetical protein